MKELLEQYASYNLWANERLLNIAVMLEPALQQQNIASSFANLQATFQHIWDAESAWFQRVKLQEQIHVPSASVNSNMQEIADGLISQSKQWEELTQKSTEAALEHVFAYYNSKKEYCKNPVWKTLLHVFNHGTYHRGQVITILHQLNVEKIPNTDFIAWTRRK